MDLRGKRLLVLSGPRLCCEIIQHARKMGIVTGVTDWYSWEDSPAKQIADEAYYENTSSMEDMRKLIQEKRFDGVFTGYTDSVLPYFGEICEKNGLPCYGTKEQFELFTDKAKYKELLRRYDIPTIPEYPIRQETLEEDLLRVEYPVLVKPADSSGARGIRICSTKEELKSAITFALDSSKKREVLVEKYMDDPEVTVFWVFLEGEYRVSLMGNRHIKHNQEGVIPLPVGYTYPSAYLPGYLRDTAPKVEAMLRDVGVHDGMMFMQCKVRDGQCYVYDIGYRLTASFEYTNCRESCGYDPLDIMIQYALTGKIEDKQRILGRIDPFLHGTFAYNVSLLGKPGRIAKIVGLDEIRHFPGVIDVVVAHPEGDVIAEKMKGLLAQICVRVLGKADSVEQMKTEILKIHDTVHIFSDEGEEMLLPGMEEADFDDSILS